MTSPFSDPGIPTLTQQIEPEITAPVGMASDIVLRALLQAELEQAIEQAASQAAADMRARLEAEVPGIVDRALQRLRPG
ncbi:hypothetical protein [Bordetella avium]|uniref:hypothetical protein n=1 Tax=Bordetella avium TaxID=521 RepID=UPI000FD930C1|nr:hypothetical protein [Bordetella avium]AZY52010.1 hypothetical protein C0J07_05435 [Bordetella avium]